MSDFNGFPKATLRFLTDLAANNDRDWFQQHRSTYEGQLMQPAQAFVRALGGRLETLAPNIQYDTRTNGSGSLMRIYRDTRFSADKTPYKTNISGMFWEGNGRKMECPAFGFQLEASRMRLMAGMFGFPKPVLAAYREAVIDNRQGSELAAILLAAQEANVYEINGAHYKRVPRGFDADHPRAEWLRHNALYLSSPEIPATIVTSDRLVDICMGYFTEMAPVQQWLVQVLANS